MFFKVLQYDLKNGFVREYKKFILAAVIFLALCVDFYLRSESIRATFGASYSTFADYLLYAFMSIPAYDPASKQPFQFPALWMLIMLFILYLVLYYPYKDLMGYGKQILINARSRCSWWLSKCCWVIISTACYFLLLYGMVFLFCFIVRVPLSLHTSEYMFLYYIPVQDRVDQYPQQLNLTLFLLPFLLIVSVGLMQMFLSLLIRPLYSYCVSVAVMLSSTYYMSPLMIGNYAMVLRSNRVIENGVNGYIGAYFLLILTVIFTVGGSVVFNRYDILNKEGS